MTLNSGDTFEHHGYTFRVEFDRDDDCGEPWKEDDGHGIVTDWTSRAKDPGERVLVRDRYGSSVRYYDVRESLIIARRDGWRCSHPVQFHAKLPALAACAVDEDFEYLRAWCADEWEYLCVSVSLVGDKSMTTTLGGVKSWKDHHQTIARELADELMAEIEVAEPQIVLSEN